MTNENGWRVRAGRRGTAAVLIAALAGIAAHGAMAQEGPPTSVVDADKIEQDNALPITPFYDTPQTLASTKPGDLLRQEEFGGYDLPEGMKAVRVLYSSVGSDDKPVATSAVVLVPDGTPPEGGWPVVAWAHGTSGIARQCAPSAMKDVYYGGILFDMVKAGFAVVATDYHGLGTEVRTATWTRSRKPMTWSIRCLRRVRPCRSLAPTGSSTVIRRVALPPGASANCRPS